MKLRELTHKLAERGHLSERRSRAFLRALIEEMSLLLLEEGRLPLHPLGTFRVKRTRQGYRILFRTSRKLKAKLQQVR